MLQQIVDVDISNEAFPHLSAGEVTLLGGKVDGRLFRLSFSGELAYEIAVPAGYGGAVAEAIMAAGAAHGICAYGLEAMGVMRIEKGHVTHSEINGTTTPEDLGLGRLVSPKKRDFIGRMMLQRARAQGRRPARAWSACKRSIPRRGCLPAPMCCARATRRRWRTTRDT